MKKYGGKNKTNDNSKTLAESIKKLKRKLGGVNAKKSKEEKKKTIKRKK